MKDITPLPPEIRQETMYMMFIKEQPKVFEGSMDLLEAKDWLYSSYGAG